VVLRAEKILLTKWRGEKPPQLLYKTAYTAANSRSKNVAGEHCVNTLQESWTRLMKWQVPANQTLHCEYFRHDILSLMLPYSLYRRAIVGDQVSTFQAMIRKQRHL